MKTWFGLASTVGYGLSKVPAYCIVSELDRSKRLRLLIGLMAVMLVATVGFFAVVPPVLKVLGMFLGAFAGSWIYGTCLLTLRFALTHGHTQHALAVLVHC